MGLQGKHAAPINQEVLGEFYGIVKSYNPEKGFGFIVCDALKHQHDGDVYLHSRHIGDFKVGQEVKFQAYLHNGRLQGRELQDATGMVGPQTGAAPGLDTEQELGVFVGKIKNYNHEKGFGFIVCEALNLQGYQGDVFLHSKNKGTFEAGDEVAFMAVLRQGKLQGKDLQAASAVLGEMGIMAPTMGGMGGSMMGMMGMMSDMDPAAKRARMY
ncbi:EF-hand domain-containing protein [Durusdinium trenchii]|eukprot:g14860.t1